MNDGEDSENRAADFRIVARRAGLRSVNCHEFSVVTLIEGPLPSMLMPHWEHDVKWKQDDDEGVLNVFVTITLRATDSESEETLVRANCKFRLAYQIDDLKETPLSAGDQQAFAELNGLYNAWPYLRQALQEATMRVGLPPFVLPLMKVEASTTDSPSQE